MNTSQLLCVLKCDKILKHINKNVLAKDELPKAPLKHFPSAYIVNSDLSGQKKDIIGWHSTLTKIRMASSSTAMETHHKVMVKCL